MLITSPSPIPNAFDQAYESIFIAGGISNCANWQVEIAELIDTQAYDVFNPRRPTGLEKTGDEAIGQIRWEYKALDTCAHVVFWFPKTSICPITLFEYGVMLEKAKTGDILSITMGRDPDYERAFDLDIQTHLAIEHMKNPNVVVAHDFEEFKAVVALQFGGQI